VEPGILPGGNRQPAKNLLSHIGPGGGTRAPSTAGKDARRYEVARVLTPKGKAGLKN
jgi:hypothetical protein